MLIIIFTLDLAVILEYPDKSYLTYYEDYSMHNSSKFLSRCQELL